MADAEAAVAPAPAPAALTSVAFSAGAGTMGSGAPPYDSPSAGDAAPRLIGCLFTFTSPDSIREMFRMSSINRPSRFASFWITS